MDFGSQSHMHRRDKECELGSIWRLPTRCIRSGLSKIDYLHIAVRKRSKPQSGGLEANRRTRRRKMVTRKSAKSRYAPASKQDSLGSKKLGGEAVTQEKLDL
jgi:hypothetical protein